MRNLDRLLENKSIDYLKLEEFGFQKSKNEWVYRDSICDEQFQVFIHISDKKKFSKVIDLLNEEEYMLVDIQDSVGEFVGKVREEYELILQDFINSCTSRNVFKSKQAKEIIQYIKNKYDDDLEFLWNKLPEAAIWRNKGNNKWYGILMIIEEKKLGIDSNKKVEIIDLRCTKEENIVNHKNIFPGYHMNKESWITIKLDGTMKTEKILEYIDKSYRINRGSGSWFIPANPHMFDIISYMDNNKVIIWDKALGVIPNDLIYIYVGAPYSAILYKCKVLSAPPNLYTKKKDIHMEVLEKYDKEKYPMALLKEHGLKTVRWAHSMPEELVEFLKGEKDVKRRKRS